MEAYFETFKSAVKFQIAATTHQVCTYDDEDEEIRAIICVTLAATFSQEVG